MSTAATEPKETISPAFKTNNVPIVLSCSDYFAPYCAAYLKSLIKYANIEYGYDILIFTKDMGEWNENLLTELADGHSNISVRFLRINPYIQQYTLKTHAHFGVESYFRLLMPYILNPYDKALYFDCDMVLKEDVAKLYAVEIGNNFLAGCLDSVVIGAINDPLDRSFGSYGWKEYCQTVMEMEDPYRYLNSGVLIFNLKRFRRDFEAQQILEYVQRKQFFLLDQDALNALCQPNVVILGHNWNMTNNNGGAKIPYIKKAPVAIAESYFEARKKPYTVHFADRLKPWKNPNEDLGYEFWETARELPCYMRILGRMCDEMYTQLITDYTPQAYPQPMGVWGEWKFRIKQLSALFLPYGSKRRLAVKKWYFKLRGWNVA